MPLFKDSQPNAINGWSCIAQTQTELEAELIAGPIRDANIPVEVLSKRDTAYSLTIGEMSLVYIYVPSDKVEEAKAFLDHE
jgi:hypothetical protein